VWWKKKKKKRITLFIFFNFLSKNTLTPSLYLKPKLISFIFLSTTSIFNETITIFLCLWTLYKTLSSIEANNPFIIVDQGERETSYKNFSLWFLSPQPLFFSFWWVLHNHITMQPNFVSKFRKRETVKRET